MKRLFLFAVALIVLFGLSGLALAEGQGSPGDVTVPDDDDPEIIVTVDEEPWTGAGTENDPFVISTAYGMSCLSQYTEETNGAEGEYFLLGRDIDLGAYCGGNNGSWTPVGSRDIPFNGFFDGGGNTISGLYIYERYGDFVGLFNTTGENAAIRNLNVSGYVYARWYAGGITAENFGTIANCRFSGNVTCTLGGGGIVGLNSGGKISGCTVDATVNGHGTLGGLVGDLGGQVEYCSFSGTVRGKNVLGGIAGNISDFGTIKDCTAEGVIAGGTALGGIAGWGRKGNEISRCSFTGFVNGLDEDGYSEMIGILGNIEPLSCVGGILGKAESRAHIEDCTFTGDVCGGNYVGGIGGDVNAEIIKCKTFPLVSGGYVSVNDGTDQYIVEVPTESGTVSGKNYVGGIAGSDTLCIKECENHLYVSGKKNVGGIAGYFCGWWTVSCINYATGMVGEKYVGGIVGYLAKDCLTGIGSCHNYSMVQGNDYVAGIAGYAGSKLGFNENHVEPWQIVGQTNTGLIYGCYDGPGAMLTLHPNGMRGTDVSYLVVPFESYMPDCPFEDDERAFFAWNTAPDASGTYYYPGQEISRDVSGDMYAIWMEIRGDGYAGAGTREAPYALHSDIVNLPSGWYVVDGLALCANRMYVNGEVNLILSSGATLSALEGIGVPHGSSLTIWGPGRLDATGKDRCAGIGGDDEGGNPGNLPIGTITINGGIITATGGQYGAGIGGGNEGSNNRLTINGGTVIATGSDGAAGIGGGDYGNGGTVVINGGNVKAFGSVRTRTLQAAAGIGAGRPRTDGSEPRRSAQVYITGGTVTAVAGESGLGMGGAQAIGVNLADADKLTNANDDRTSLPVGYRVTAGLAEDNAVTVMFADQIAGTRMNYARIEPCVEHSLNGRLCRYCEAPIGHSGNGTADSPYTIRNAEEWNRLADYIAAGLDTRGLYFRQEGHLTVSRMIGTSGNPFNGCWEGQGWGLTFVADAVEAYCAPFRYVGEATFTTLRIDGTINTVYKFAAGLVGKVTTSCRIVNCKCGTRIVSTVTGDGTHGGFVAVGKNVLYEGCSFVGVILGGETTMCGGFQGWDDGDSRCVNCMFAGALDTKSDSAPFIRNSGDTENCYYTNPVGQGRDRGKQAVAVTEEPGITINWGEGSNYRIAGLYACPTGMIWNERFHAGAGETVNLTIAGGGTGDGAVCGYACDGAVLTRDGEGWTLLLSDVGAYIRALPAFGEPDFTLPAALNAIEEEAFEGIAAAVVDVPAGCTSVGDYAFRNCPNLTQIRVPAGCPIGEGAFDGCGIVYVYSAPGSPAEAYSATHDNCVFVPEAPN